jgi:hypothetical protein
MNSPAWSHRSLTPRPEEDIGLLGDITTEDAGAGWVGITVAGARDA